MLSLRSAGPALLSIVVVLAALIAATQWAAAMLAYQPALGTPALDLAGVKLYPPWKVLVWWLAFEPQAPAVFARAGALVALGGIAAGLIAFGGAVWRAGRTGPLATYGSARWACAADVRKAGLTANQGIVLGVHEGCYLRHDGPEHVLAVAPTRSGKGVGLVVPTLLTWPGSAVIHDIKGENWALTAGWRAQFSRCLRFDPTHPVSARFNPLLEVRKGVHEVRDVHNIADILVDPEGARQWRDHWEKSELWGTGPYPPRTIVEVQRLNQDDILEVEGTFYARRAKCPTSKRRIARLLARAGGSLCRRPAPRSSTSGE